jgi:hypothetical protein
MSLLDDRTEAWTRMAERRLEEEESKDLRHLTPRLSRMRVPCLPLSWT